MEREFSAPTPHLDCPADAFGKTAIMPGDPLRSKYIAENYLENPVLVTNTRAIHAYTGFYKGKKISICAHGMGMPSMGIYSYELFNIFGVDNIIRVGTCAAYQEKSKLKDIIVAMGATTDSNYASQYQLPATFAPIASYDLLRRTVDELERRGLGYAVGNMMSSDFFYSENENKYPSLKKMGILGGEMESAALYMNAARAGKNAVAMFTVAKHNVTGESTTAEERQNSFTGMMEVALEVAYQVTD